MRVIVGMVGRVGRRLMLMRFDLLVPYVGDWGAESVRDDGMVVIWWWSGGKEERLSSLSISRTQYKVTISTCILRTSTAFSYVLFDWRCVCSGRDVVHPLTRPFIFFAALCH
jgi:hypothetical protein